MFVIWPLRQPRGVHTVRVPRQPPPDVWFPVPLSPIACACCAETRRHGRFGVAKLYVGLRIQPMSGLLPHCRPQRCQHWLAWLLHYQPATAVSMTGQCACVRGAPRTGHNTGHNLHCYSPLSDESVHTLQCGQASTPERALERAWLVPNLTCQQRRTEEEDRGVYSESAHERACRICAHLFDNL